MTNNRRNGKTKELTEKLIEAIEKSGEIPKHEPDCVVCKQSLLDRIEELNKDCLQYSTPLPNAYSANYLCGVRVYVDEEYLRWVRGDALAIIETEQQYKENRKKIDDMKNWKPEFEPLKFAYIDELESIPKDSAKYADYLYNTFTEWQKRF